MQICSRYAHSSKRTIERSKFGSGHRAIIPCEVWVCHLASNDNDDDSSATAITPPKNAPSSFLISAPSHIDRISGGTCHHLSSFIAPRLINKRQGKAQVLRSFTSHSKNARAIASGFASETPPLQPPPTTKLSNKTPPKYQPQSHLPPSYQSMATMPRLMTTWESTKIYSKAKTALLSNSTLNTYLFTTI